MKKYLKLALGLITISPLTGFVLSCGNSSKNNNDGNPDNGNNENPDNGSSLSDDNRYDPGYNKFKDEIDLHTDYLSLQGEILVPKGTKLVRTSLQELGLSSLSILTYTTNKRAKHLKEGIGYQEWTDLTITKGLNWIHNSTHNYKSRFGIGWTSTYFQHYKIDYEKDVILYKLKTPIDHRTWYAYFHRVVPVDKFDLDYTKITYDNGITTPYGELVVGKNTPNWVKSLKWLWNEMDVQYLKTENTLSFEHMRDNWFNSSNATDLHGWSFGMDY